MGIMIFMLKSQRRAFRWPNNLRARLYIILSLHTTQIHIPLLVFVRVSVVNVIAKCRVIINVTANVINRLASL